MSNSWGMLSIVHRVCWFLTNHFSVGQVFSWPQCLIASTVGSAIWPMYLRLRLRYVGSIGTRRSYPQASQQWKRKQWHFWKLHLLPILLIRFLLHIKISYNSWCIHSVVQWIPFLRSPREVRALYCWLCVERSLCTVQQSGKPGSSVVSCQ